MSTDVKTRTTYVFYYAFVGEMRVDADTEEEASNIFDDTFAGLTTQDLQEHSHLIVGDPIPMSKE